ncbi:MAG: ATP-binding cassette domain-containing protein [Spirochaetales bacterium]|nr:ATP-binding cassette domain-containing protein [Spirochaetales bacterium]
MTIIETANLSKTFYISKKKKGIRGAVKGLLVAKKTAIEAVKGISFSVQQGEIVGYIGPNGAGKSTTIKMLCGILHPTSGRITVNNLSLPKQRKKLAMDIGVVFGQRSQLYWDIRLGESFELLKRMYDISDKDYEHRMGVFNELLGINDIIDQPVRQLSLGQSMRGNLVSAFLHAPKLLFLDEPTIGLDIVGKRKIQTFIREMNREHKTTVLLTTHDLSDVEKLCERLIVINQGVIVEDDNLKSIVYKLAPYKLVHLVVDGIIPKVNIPGCRLKSIEANKLCLEYDHHTHDTVDLINNLSRLMNIVDFNILDPDIEDVIEAYYSV